MNTKLKYRQDFLEECLDYIKELKFNLINAATGKSVISFGQKITQTNSLDVLRIVYETKTANESSVVLRNAILEMILASTRINKASAFYAALNFCECFLHKNAEFSDITEDIKSLCYMSRRTQLVDIIDHLNIASGNDESFKLLKILINHVGFNTSLFVNDSKKWNSQIKISSSFEFEGSMHESFSLITKTQTWESSNVDCLVVDGIIESVGEIHHIFELYNQNKKKLCIIARGYQEEVIATMATNFLRKTLYCIPVIIPSNLNTINSFKDIAIVSKADMISSLKGETISSIKPEQIGKVEFISLTKSQIAITNQVQDKAAYKHVLKLQKKMEGEEEDIRRLLEKRIISLSPRSAKIFIGKHTGETSGLIKDRLNLGVAILNSSCKYGIITLKDIPNLSYKPLNNTVKLLKDLGFKACPAEAIVEGLKVSTTASQNLKNSGIFILLD